MITVVDSEWGITPDGMAELAQVEPERVYQWLKDNLRYPLKTYNALSETGIVLDIPFYSLDVFIEVLGAISPENLNLYAKIGLKRYCEVLCNESEASTVLTDT